MNVASRGVRNAFRNGIRTFSIVIILGLSVGLALSMLVARQAVNQKISSVKSSIGNTITVSPAGVQGFSGGGEPLTTDQLAKVAKVAHVTKVVQTLNDRLTTDSTNLVSAVDPGTLGRRFAGNSGVGFQAPPPDETRRSSSNSSGQTQITRTFTPPVTLTGTNDTSSMNLNFTSGQNLDTTKDSQVAVVGKALAEKNNLKVGSTLTVYGQTVTVVGIYDAQGNAFQNAGLVMSLPTTQRLSSQPNQVDNATVTVDSVDNLNSTVTAIKNTLGDKADVTSNQDTATQAIEPLQSVKSVALYSLIGALGAGAIIILLTMMMIVRERRREIGVMKAIGSSNVKVVVQFVCEAVTLTLLGLVVGLVIGIAASSPVTKVLVNNSTSSAQTIQAPGQGGGFRRLRAFGLGGNNNIRNVQASVGPDILAYGIGAALFIAIVGSAVPAALISKVRPAEVMRAE